MLRSHRADNAHSHMDSEVCHSKRLCNKHYRACLWRSLPGYSNVSKRHLACRGVDGQHGIDVNRFFSTSLFPELIWLRIVPPLRV